MFLVSDVHNTTSKDLVIAETEEDTNLKFKMEGLHLNPALGGVTKGTLENKNTF